MTIEVVSCRHSWPEKAGFVLERSFGHPKFTFLHFYNSVSVRIGGRIVCTEPHACLIYNIGTPQYFVSPTALTHDWVHFSGDLLPLLARYQLATDTLYYPTSYGDVTAIVQEMENEVFARRPDGEALLSLKTEELFLKLSRSCGSSYMLSDNLTMKERFHPLRNKVFSDLGRKWTVKEMASLVGLSESRFYSLYKSLYGTSPIDDLIRARCEVAVNALAYGNKTVAEIAESLGYDNLPHFMRQFRRFTGVSPARYRKEQRLFFAQKKEQSQV